LREVRACVACITHYSLEYIGGLPYPELDELIKAYVKLKGGGKISGRKRPMRPDMPELPDNVSPAESQAYSRELLKENEAAKRGAVHVSMLPLEVQHAISTKLRRVPRPGD
jgi:hypothetical protein